MLAALAFTAGWPRPSVTRPSQLLKEREESASAPRNERRKVMRSVVVGNVLDAGELQADLLADQGGSRSRTLGAAPLVP